MGRTPHCASRSIPLNIQVVIKAIMIRLHMKMHDRLLDFIGRIIFPRPFPMESKHSVKIGSPSIIAAPPIGHSLNGGPSRRIPGLSPGPARSG